MHRFSRLVLGSALLLLGAAPHARAVTVLQGSLFPVDGTGSTATGSGVILLDGLNMNVNISFSNLTGDATSAVLTTPTFFPLLIPFPSGTALSLTADFVLTPEQLIEVLAAFPIVTVSSTAFPAGELSGPLDQKAEGNVGSGNPKGPPVFEPTPVPEPSGFLLSLTGLWVAGTMAMWKMRRRTQ